MKTRITTLMLTARKAKDTVALQTYQAILAAFVTFEKEKKVEPTDTEKIAILRKMETARREVAVTYTVQKRDDLAAIELREADLIKELLPTVMNFADAYTYITNYVANNNSDISKKNMGGLVKELVASALGELDGKTASMVVSRLITDLVS